MTNPITDPKQAGERLLTFASEKRLVQKKWHDNVDGREFACLLGAAAGIDDATQCPASLMPTWLAKLLPGLFDALEEAQAMSFARRWGEAMVRDEWPRIDWNAVRKQWLAFVVRQAKTAASTAAAAAAAAAAVYAASADAAATVYAVYAAAVAAAAADASADADAASANAAAYSAAADSANAAAYSAAAAAAAVKWAAAVDTVDDANARPAQAEALMAAIAAAMAEAKEAT